MQPYIILYSTTLHIGVRNLPKVFTVLHGSDLAGNRISYLASNDDDDDETDK